MEVRVTLTVVFIVTFSLYCSISESISDNIRRDTILVNDDDDVAWVVQLSDLHFSVHHPERARDFVEMVGPTLSLIKPFLVLITGDLTDGKSKDLLTMKQDENEWIEYRNVMDEVIERSGLDKSIFYDLRGNHDNFGVPAIGSSFDFFSKYSINSRNGRKGQVNSVTVQTAARKFLFVGFDSTMSTGLRGPTNLFGHPTDQLLSDMDLELSKWNSTERVTKISFGHFPLSFSAASSSGKSLKDVFLKNSVSAYLCGHLHTRFGRNLKRHHYSNGSHLIFPKLFQLNAQWSGPEITDTCSKGVPPSQEFWEWEMGDWRKSRAIRILAIDRGQLSFVDTDFKLGAKKIIILPTFPLDSRFMSILSANKYKCKPMDPPSSETIRALVFSFSPIVSVVARIYDSRSGNLDMVFEAFMKKHTGTSLKRDLYVTPWNYKAFEDSSPNRYWLQMEVVDTNGRLALSDLRPFSINGLRAKLSWTWKEFIVMGCEWDSLYYPILWSFYLFALSILLIPKTILSFSKMQYNYKNFTDNKGLGNCILWIFNEYYGVPLLWWGMLVYLFYLVLFPWLVGHVSTEGGERGYMTYKGWVVNLNKRGKLEFMGSPDVMVVVLPHLFFVVLPTFLVNWAFAAERGIYRYHFLSLSGKKEDDRAQENSYQGHNSGRNGRLEFLIAKRWIRYILMLVSLVICWKHFTSCRALIKAYEMNPFLHFPVYSFSIPLFLVCSFYKTRNV